jgi:hypothetical protein
MQRHSPLVSWPPRSWDLRPVLTAFLGNVGLEWQVMGFGNFSSLGETDMVLRNANTGGVEFYDIKNNQITGANFSGTMGLEWQVEVYDISNNQIASTFSLGAVGLDWQVVGFGPMHGPGTSDMVLRNVNTGAFEVYDISNNQITAAASLGQVGLDWQPGVIAAAQLVQAMAGFGGGSGAAESLTTVPLGADTSQQTPKPSAALQLGRRPPRASVLPSP